MRRRAAETRDRKDLSGASATKYVIPDDPLQMESRMSSMVPMNSDEADRMITIANSMLEDKSLTDGERRALETWKMSIGTKAIKGQVQHEFVRDFWAWLLGRGKDSDHARTPWGRQSVAYDGEVKQYVDLMYSQMHHYKVKINLLAHRVPEGINEFFIYYKYIVRGEPLDKTHFLNDFEIFTDEFKAARKLGQEHRDPAGGPHEVAPYGDLRDRDEQSMQYGMQAVFGDKFNMDTSEEFDATLEREKAYQKAVKDGTLAEFLAEEWDEQEADRQEAYREAAAEEEAEEAAEFKTLREEKKNLDEMQKEYDKAQKEVQAMDEEDELAKMQELDNAMEEAERLKDEAEAVKGLVQMDETEDEITDAQRAKLEADEKKEEEKLRKEYEENKMQTDQDSWENLTPQERDKIYEQDKKADEKERAENEKAEREEVKAKEKEQKAKAKAEKQEILQQQREKIQEMSEKMKESKRAANEKFKEKIGQMKEKSDVKSIEAKLKNLSDKRALAIQLQDAALKRRSELMETKDNLTRAGQSTKEVNKMLNDAQKMVDKALASLEKNEAAREALTAAKEQKMQQRQENVQQAGEALQKQARKEMGTLDVQEKLLAAVLDLTTQIKELAGNLKSEVGEKQQNIGDLKKVKKTAKSMASTARKNAVDDTTTENVENAKIVQETEDLARVTELQNSPAKQDKFFKESPTKESSKKRAKVQDKLMVAMDEESVDSSVESVNQAVAEAFEFVPIDDNFDSNVRSLRANVANFVSEKFAFTPGVVPESKKRQAEEVTASMALDESAFKKAAADTITHQAALQEIAQKEKRTADLDATIPEDDLKRVANSKKALTELEKERNRTFVKLKQAQKSQKAMTKRISKAREKMDKIYAEGQREQEAARLEAEEAARLEAESQFVDILNDEPQVTEEEAALMQQQLEPEPAPEPEPETDDDQKQDEKRPRSEDEDEEPDAERVKKVEKVMEAVEILDQIKARSNLPPKEKEEAVEEAKETVVEAEEELQEEEREHEIDDMAEVDDKDEKEKQEALARKRELQKTEFNPDSMLSKSRQGVTEFGESRGRKKQLPEKKKK